MSEERTTMVPRDGRVHQSLRITPAMAAGVTDHVWTLDEVIGLLEAAERKVAAN
jgi:hypothetical protein